MPDTIHDTYLGARVLQEALRPGSKDLKINAEQEAHLKKLGNGDLMAGARKLIEKADNSYRRANGLFPDPDTVVSSYEEKMLAAFAKQAPQMGVKDDYGRANGPENMQAVVEGLDKQSLGHGVNELASLTKRAEESLKRAGLVDDPLEGLSKKERDIIHRIGQKYNEGGKFDKMHPGASADIIGCRNLVDAFARNPDMKLDDETKKLLHDLNGAAQERLLRQNPVLNDLRAQNGTGPDGAGIVIGRNAPESETRLGVRDLNDAFAEFMKRGPCQIGGQGVSPLAANAAQNLGSALEAATGPQRYVTKGLGLGS